MMASVVNLFLFLSFAAGTVRGEAFTFLDNTTFWVDDAGKLMFFSGTREWLAGTLNQPQIGIVDFGDTRRAGESVAVHYAWHQKVISERGTKTIAVYKGTSSLAVHAHVGTSPRVGHVTVDWLSNNVYWADAGFGWIGLQALKENITSLTVNSRLKVVVSSSLESPYGVAVLPQIKRLFWSDHGSTPKLESSDLLGSHRRILVWQGLAKPTAMSADHTTRLLYWVDEAKGTVESCDQEGKGRRIVLFVQGSSLAGLQVFENSIIVSERIRGELQAYDKDTGRLTATPITRAPNAGDVAVFSSALQPRDSSTCTSASCDHICIHDEGCVCTSGYVLENDGKTCTERATSLWKSFLVSTGTQICAIQVNLLFSHPYLPPDHIANTILCFIDNAGIDFLAVDSLNATLYYNAGRNLRRFQMYTGNDERMVSASGDITGMAYDWLSGTLVWTQHSPVSLVYSYKEGDTLATVVYHSVDNPSHITIDSYRGNMFWVEKPDGATSAQIWIGSVDGSETKTSIVSSDLTRPQYMTYDHKSDKLYWLDVDQVGVIDPDGTHKHIVTLSSLDTYIGLAIFRSYIVWLSKDTGTNMMFRNVELTEDDNVTTFSLPSKIGDVKDLVFYDPSVNLDSGTVSCELDNGGCSQLCIVNGVSYFCRCSFGFRLHQDGVTCISEHVSTNFFLVADALGHQLYQIDGDSNEVSAIALQNGAQPELVVFNWVTGDIIWYDSEAAAIKLSLLDGSSVRVVRSLKEAGQSNTVGALCLDYSTNNLFFTEIRADNSRGWIRVISLDTKVMRTLYESTTPPRFLAIAPSQGQLVFGTDAGFIYLSDIPIEGSSPQRLMSGVTKLSGLVFSDDGTSVQWSDDEEDGLWRMPLSTRTAQRRLHNSGSHPRALYAWGSTLYYLTASGRTINALSSADTESTVVEFPEFGHLTSLHFFGRQAPEESTGCSEKNGRCSTLCLPTPNSGRQCQCADGVSLLPDKRTCSDVEQCPSEVRNGQLSALCDRYPGETCDYACDEGYAANPGHPHMRCSGASGLWNVSTDSLCLRTCPRRVLDHGQMSADCPLVAGRSCRITCDDGFELAGEASEVECQQDGEWLVPSDTMCQESPEEELLPVYAIAIISAGGVGVVAVILGCVLYRRMKRHGGRDSTHAPGLGLPGHGHHVAGGAQTPVVFVTPDLEGGATGGKHAEEEVYSELEPVADGDRYSPLPGKKPVGSSNNAVGFLNHGFDHRDGGKNLRAQNDYTEPLPDYNRLSRAPAPPPYQQHTQGLAPPGGDYLTPASASRQREPPTDNGDYLKPGEYIGRPRPRPQQANPQPHTFHRDPLPDPMPPSDYMTVIPPSPRPEQGAGQQQQEFVPLRKMSRSDWTA